MSIKQSGIALLAGSFLLAAGIAQAGSFEAVKAYPPGQNADVIVATLTRPLIHQGFENLMVEQAGDQLTVTGSHQFALVTMVYDSATGNLVSVSKATDWDAITANDD